MKKNGRKAEENCCAICGLNLDEEALYFSIEKQGKAICEDCVKQMFPSRMNDSGITLAWQFVSQAPQRHGERCRNHCENR